MPIWAVAFYEVVIEPWRIHVMAALGALTLTGWAVFILLGLYRRTRKSMGARKIKRLELWANIAVMTCLACGPATLALAWSAQTLPGLLPQAGGDLLFVLAIAAGGLSARCALRLAFWGEGRHTVRRDRRDFMAAVGGLDFCGAAGGAVLAGVLFALAIWVPQQW